MAFRFVMFQKKMFIICVSSNVPFPLTELRNPAERQQRLRGILTTYNYRLEAPVRNLRSQADASESYPEELKAFVDNHEPLKKARGKLRIATLN